MQVVAFTGLPGSGKSVAADVARKLGVPVVRMGDCVWDEVRARGLPLEDAHVGRVAQEMRAAHGPGVWAQRTLERISALKADRVAIDGVRSLAEVETFRAGLGSDFLLVAIHAPPAVRHARLLARGRADETLTPEAARERDRRELAWGVAEAIALADRVVVNDVPTEEAFRHQVEAYLKVR